MRTYRVGVCYEEGFVMKVKATSEEDAEEKAKVICDGCGEDFNILTNDMEAKNWYVEKPLSSCSHHTKDNKKTTIHKTKRYSEDN